MKNTLAAIATLTILSSCRPGLEDIQHPINGFVKDTIVNGIELVFVPAGPYRFGLNAQQKEITYDYYIGRFEVTNEQYFRFLSEATETGFLDNSDSTVKYFYPGDEQVPPGIYHVKIFDDKIRHEGGQITLDSAVALHPVTSVTWYGAKAFCDYYNFELPSIFEWEKAARGNNNVRFPWGNTIDGSYANFQNSEDPYEPETTPVGFYDGRLKNEFQTSDAVSYFGCYDMAGNAWEWTRTPWTSETPYHIGKGGGHTFHSPAHLQIYYMSTYGPSKAPNLDMCDRPDGFRVVLKLLR